jgi:hypothetical protein
MKGFFGGIKKENNFENSDRNDSASHCLLLASVFACFHVFWQGCGVESGNACGVGL